MTAPEAPAVTGLVVGDAPEVWASLGFAVDGDHVDVGGVRITLTGDGTGLRRWTLAGVALESDQVEGVPTDLVEPPGGPSPQHPNGVVELDHVVLSTPDVDRTIRTLQAIGLDLRRERRAGTSESPLRQAFFRPRGTIIELVGPPEPAGDGPARLFGVAFSSADLDATAAFLGDRLKPAKGAVQRGRRIATVSKAAGSACPIAIMSPHVGEDDQ